MKTITARGADLLTNEVYEPTLDMIFIDDYGIIGLSQKAA